MGRFGGDPRLRLAILLAVVPRLVPTRASGVLLIFGEAHLQISWLILMLGGAPTTGTGLRKGAPNQDDL